MEKYSVFFMTQFFTGIIRFSSEEEILQNLEEIELPDYVWECNDEGFEDQSILSALTQVAIGPGNGATFVNQPEPDDFKNYLYIQRNF